MSDGNNELRDAIVGALKSVVVPGGPDVIAAGVVAGISGADETLTIECHAGNWPEPIRNRIEGEMRMAVQQKLPQLAEVKVDWKEGAPPAQATPGQAQAGPAAPGQPEGPNIKHVIAVGSGKGGVGKSTVAASLAYALRHRGAAVGIMDADVYGPSIPHMLGLSGQPAVADNRYIPPEVDGVKAISMGMLVPPGQAVVWRGPMLHKAVRDFLYSVAWGPLDYLVVDLPPGTGDVVLSLSQQMPLAGGVIVCTPQDVALLDARKALQMFETVKIPCLGIVENMSFFECPKCQARTEIFGHGGAERWATDIGAPFLGSIPINLQVRINGDTGHLRDNFVDGSAVRENLLAITERLVANVLQNARPKAPTLEIVD